MINSVRYETMTYLFIASDCQVNNANCQASKVSTRGAIDREGYVSRLALSHITSLINRRSVRTVRYQQLLGQEPDRSVGGGRLTVGPTLEE